ncbi:hypothetical protein PDJAM_G00032540 [Pangasius djambal]|uniref:Uncharacterized protein n=1 Tax=Pangasius djambal TaxID=1691987 RepID=A0ACC5YS00_9TELE|nr:hypothetical protein [Pangasius djambal]
MTVQKGKRMTISIQEHMAINVCPGPIRPIRQISAYFPRLSPTSSVSDSLSPNQAGFPSTALAGGGASGGGGLLSPLSPRTAAGGGTLSMMNSMETSVEIDSGDSDDNTSLGTLAFDLLYESSTSSLHCTVLRAKKVHSQLWYYDEPHGTAVPYSSSVPTIGLSLPWLKVCFTVSAHDCSKGKFLMGMGGGVEPSPPSMSP